jgi:choline kinase
MKAIILAAGKGTRLNGVELKPKCLFEVGGRTLLDRQKKPVVSTHCGWRANI